MHWLRNDYISLISISVVQAAPVGVTHWKCVPCNYNAPSLTPARDFCLPVTLLLLPTASCLTHAQNTRRYPEIARGQTFDLTYNLCLPPPPPFVAGLQWWLVAGPWTQRRDPSSSSLFSVSQSSTPLWALTCENKLFSFPKNSNNKGWWTLFIRNTCMKTCLRADLSLMILFCTVPLEFLYSWITFLQHSKVKGFFVEYCFICFESI